MIFRLELMDMNSSAVFRLSMAGLVLFCAGINLYSAEEQKSPPKELVQYVRDAAKLGLKDLQIQQNALKAGWSAETVNEAIAYVHTASQASSRADAPDSAPPPDKPVVTPAPSTSLAPASPAAVPGDRPASAAASPSPSVSDTPPSQKTRGVPDDYQIGAGDTLQISVWKEPEASVQNTVVRPDGKIGMPLLKEVEVVGLTPTEAEKLIASGLSKYIPGADVTVVVSGIHSKKIYIVGAVKKEGPISYTYRMTVMQALSEAGGLNDYAKRKKIYVLRTENGKEYKLPFDYDAVLKGERMELNIPLLPNDTLVVPH
jgi:polysaccharide export outer membrane protein